MIGYLKYFLKDKNVASILPTRKKIVRNLCSQINFHSSNTVVEYGPGLGVISKQLLKLMRRDARLFVFETNSEMARVLPKRINDSRLTVYCESALDARDVLPRRITGKVDSIVSGIPLSMLSPPERRALFVESYDLLKTGGLFLIYQVIPMLKNRIGYDLNPELSEFFKRVDHHDEAISIPPLRIYRAYK